MTFEPVQPGLRGEVRLVVAEEHTARHLGSGGVQVLATPQMVLLMERAGVAAVDHLLPDGHLTVGGHLDVRHLAPTPVGFEVRATADLVAVDARRLDFRVEVHDGVELVGTGSHQRFIVDLDRFGQRVAEKAARNASGDSSLTV
ncbi:MAG: thioesterase family protein [Anaerolineae bacterium]|jgi:predicted thioesterase